MEEIERVKDEGVKKRNSDRVVSYLFPARVFVCKFCPIPDGVNRPSLHYTTSHRWIFYYRSNPRCVDKVLQIN